MHSEVWVAETGRLCLACRQSPSLNWSQPGWPSPLLFHYPWGPSSTRQSRMLPVHLHYVAQVKEACHVRDVILCCFCAFICFCICRDLHTSQACGRQKAVVARRKCPTHCPSVRIQYKWERQRTEPGAGSPGWVLLHVLSPCRLLPASLALLLASSLVPGK